MYFIFISDYGNSVRQKANLSNILIWAQNGLQNSKTICNINNAFGAGTANGHKVQGWVKKFYRVRQPSGVDSVGWRAITEAGPLTTTREVAKEANRHPLYSHLVLKVTGKVSKLDEWVPREPTKNQSFMLKSCVLLFYTTTMNRFSICDMQRTVDFIGQLVTTSSVTGPRRSQTKVWKPKLAQEKKGYGHCLVVCYQSDPLQLSKSLRNYYIWEGCSTNPWGALKIAKPAASFGQQKGPNSSHRPTDVTQPTLEKLNEFGYEVLPHLSYSHQPTTTSSISITFCRENASTTAGGRTCFPRVCWILKLRFLHYRNNKLTSYWQKCVDFNGSYFD